MKNKLKLLLACFAAFGLMGVASACDNTPDNPVEPPVNETPVTKYTIKFVDYDGTEISSAEYEEGATVTAPADPTREGDEEYVYTFAGWDKDVVAATEDATYTATYTQAKAEYTYALHINPMDRMSGTVLVTAAWGEAITAETPTAEGKVFKGWIDAEGNTVTIPETMPVGGGVAYANWEITPYTLTVVNGDETTTLKFGVQADPTNEIEADVLALGFILEGMIPANTAEYTYAWAEEVPTEFALTNYTFTVVKTAVEYTATIGGEVNAEIKFTVENAAEKLAEIAAKLPANTAEYTYAWAEALPETLALQDYTLTVNKTAVEYTITFKNGEEVVDTVSFNVENKAEKVAPAIPEKEGYTSAWGAYDFTKLENQEVAVEYTANTYKITFNKNGGACDVEDMQVTYDDTYNLPVATAPKAYQEFLGWVDEDGNAVKQGDAWRIAKDVTLTANYSAGVAFETLTEVPSYMSKADSTESLSIVEMDGNKVLEVKAEAGGASPALKVTLEFLKQFFDDENVDYVAFDAKAAQTTINNFRRVTLRSNGTFAADCYEQDMTYEHDADGDGTKETYATTGIRADSWKTFYFSRADYNAWVNQGVTEERLIAAGQCVKGDSIYVDNIRPVTAEERAAGIYSFESGGVRINDQGQTLLLYILDSGSDWQFNMQVASGQQFTNVGYTNEYATDGIRALKFTKPAGNLAINFPSSKTTTYEKIVTKTGYWAIDVYIPVGSGATIHKDSTGLSNADIPCVVPTEGAWTTIYLSGGMNKLMISDTNGGTYYIDNLRSITAEEYASAQYGFEAGTVGLRTNLLNDENTNKGAAYIYNKGTDYSGVKASISISEGNGAGDVNAVSNVRFENKIVHSGSYSLAFDKGNGYVSFGRHAQSTAVTTFAGGFTFWIYSTVELDGVNGKAIGNGVNGKYNGGEGIIVPANTWTQITVTADEITADGRFMIMQGNWSGTIYLDDFQPLPQANA